MKDIADQTVEIGDFVMGTYLNNNTPNSVIGIIVNVVTQLITLKNHALVKFRQYDRNVCVYIHTQHLIKLPADYVGHLMFSNPKVLPIVGE